MIITVDIGNTRTHFGLFEGRKLLKATALETLRIPYLKSLPIKTRASIDAVIFASVNPRVEKPFIKIVKRNFKILPLKLGRDIKVPIPIKVDFPSKIGIDRLANCIAAYEYAKTACIAIDIGTAITLDVVSKNGEFIGGIIAPGITISSMALKEHCALLPKVKLVKPQKVIGKNTISCIRAGLFYSVVGLMEKVIENVSHELGTTPYIIGTGGDIHYFRGFGIFDKIIPYLTLEGIAISYNKIKS